MTDEEAQHRLNFDLGCLVSPAGLCCGYACGDCDTPYTGPVTPEHLRETATEPPARPEYDSEDAYEPPDMEEEDDE